MTDRAPVDVLIIGGGIAGVCAAITARQTGARVRLLEAAGHAVRGGNARHARNLRAVHLAPTRYSPSRYTVEDFVGELADVAAGGFDQRLSRQLATESATVVPWLISQGVPFQLSSPLLPTSRRTSFLLGGGKTMMNVLYRKAAALGVRIDYDSRCIALAVADLTATIRTPAGIESLNPGAVVLCCGSAPAPGLINRGVPHHNATLLQSLFSQGIAAAGTPGACHLVAVDARSPPADGGIATRVLGIPHGIVVDPLGRRFHDEGADTGPTRYSVWGQKIAQQPSQLAWLILDAAGLRQVPKPLYPPVSAHAVADLAALAGIDAGTLTDTVRTYNAAVGCATGGVIPEPLIPPKSTHAQPLSKPPFSAIPMRSGLTYVCHGVLIDGNTNVMTTQGTPGAGLFAAGTIMAANILGTGYLAGAGLTIGIVFGRRAGEAAARHARCRQTTTLRTTQSTTTAVAPRTSPV
jgi:tricarballylate dehydrogenase